MWNLFLRIPADQPSRTNPHESLIRKYLRVPPRRYAPKTRIHPHFISFYGLSSYQPPSTNINHHQPPSTTINHVQPPSTTINHHQLWNSMQLIALWVINHYQPLSTTINCHEIWCSLLSEQGYPALGWCSSRCKWMSNHNYRYYRG